MDNQLVSYRVYNSLPVFMEYRKLNLVMGSTSFGKRKKTKDVNSDSWLLEKDFEDVIFSNDYILAETVNEVNGGRVFIFVFSEVNTIERETPTLRKMLQNLPYGDTVSEYDYVIFITKKLIDNTRMNNLINKSPVPLYNYAYRWILSNPFNHVAVPAMRILSEDEVDTVLRYLRRNKTDFPRMKYTDRVNIFLNAQIGDMIEITRKTNTGDTITYSLID